MTERRDGKVWAPGHGWLSEPQQRALRSIADASLANGREYGLECWVTWPSKSLSSTLASLSRRGLVELTAVHARLTADGADIVRRWQEAEAA